MKVVNAPTQAPTIEGCMHFSIANAMILQCSYIYIQPTRNANTFDAVFRGRNDGNYFSFQEKKTKEQTNNKGDYL